MAARWVQTKVFPMRTGSLVASAAGGPGVLVHNIDCPPKSTLPRDIRTGDYLPDPAAEGSPHTTLGKRVGRKGTYTQGATFDGEGNFKGITDVTNHGRGHFSPHWHPENGPDSIIHGPHPLPTLEELGLE